MGAFDSSPSALTPGKPEWSPLGDEVDKAPKVKPAEPAPEAKPEAPAAKPGPDLFSGIGKGAAAAQQHIAALEAEKMKLNPPQIGLPPKPEPKRTSPVEQWGSFAMMFAALGGMMSRNHMTTALNAASSVMNAFKENDTKKAEDAFKQWESSNKTAIQLYEFQQRAYEQALGRIDKAENLALKQGGENDKAAAAKINALLHAFGDAPGIAAYQHGGLPEFEAYKKKQADALEKLKEHSEEVGKNGTEVLARKKLMETPEYKKASPMEQRDMLLENYHKFYDRPLVSKEKVAASEPDPVLVNKLKKFELDPPSALKMKYDPELAAAYKEARKDPTYDENLAKTIATARIELEKGTAGKTLTALGTAYDHLDYLKTLSHALPNGSNIQQANAWAASVAAQFGHPEVTTFETARAIVVPEIIKALVNGQGGVEERKEMQEKFATKFTAGQLDQAFESARSLLGAKAEQLINGQLRAFVNAAPEVAAKHINPKVLAAYKESREKEELRAKGAEVAHGRAPKPEGAAPKPEGGAKPVEITDEASARRVLDMPDDAQVTVNGKTGPVSAIRGQLKKKLGL